MPAPRTTQLCPPLSTLDDLLLLRSGAVAVDPEHPMRLVLPDAPTSGAVELVDAEGVPFARIDAARSDEGQVVLTGQPAWLGQVSARPFEQLYLPPEQVRSAALADDSVTVVVDRRPEAADLDRFGAARLTLLVPAGPSVEPSAHTLAVIRAALTLSRRRAGTRVVTVPVSAADAAARPALLASIIDAYSPRGAERLLPRRPASDEPSPDGLVLFFTGLSGSGKSTVARAVRNAILERSGRPTTLLDGDVVRRNLSAGLGFSAADRETNIRRIGWVAAQIAHHGGLAICSPIAPYDSTRQEVRRMVTERGGALVLVHIATPVEECERRDRKGLYAKARRGEIPDFTGISAPYEPPQDADLVLDTTHLTLDEARDKVLRLLDRRGL